MLIYQFVLFIIPDFVKLVTRYEKFYNLFLFFSTILVEPGCRAEVTQRGDILIQVLKLYARLKEIINILIFKWEKDSHLTDLSLLFLLQVLEKKEHKLVGTNLDRIQVHIILF